MSTQGIYLTLFWVGVIAYMWFQARKAESNRLKGQRHKGDTRRMILLACVLGVGFIAVLYLLPLVAARIPWNFGYISLSAAAAVLVGVIFLFGVGLFFSRKSEDVSTAHTVRDALQLLGWSLLIIAGIGLWIALTTWAGMSEQISVWGGAIALGIVMFSREVFLALHRRRHSARAPGP